MGLLSFLQRQPANDQTPPAGRQRKKPGASGDAVQVARIRARQRLIGAAVLLGIGVIGFPLLFETQPRPIPVDLPIEIPRKDQAPALQVPPARPAASVSAAPVAADTAEPVATASPPVIEETAADAGRDIAPPVVTVPERPSRQASSTGAVADRTTAEAEERRSTSKPAAAASRPTAAASRPTASTGKTPADAARAKALLEGKPEKPAGDAGRFVVQVGAFGETGAAQTARQKVEKLGLKTYTQVVETDGGRRIRVRVGPFGSKEEAQQAAAKLRSAGLGGAVLTL